MSKLTNEGTVAKRPFRETDGKMMLPPANGKLNRQLFCGVPGQ
ncbi:MAG: hypothetical protein AAGK14_05415 [Verrucomicrobiota bacterium]